jgi:hypothetical protein
LIHPEIPVIVTTIITSDHEDTSKMGYEAQFAGKKIEHIKIATDMNEEETVDVEQNLVPINYSNEIMFSESEIVQNGIENIEFSLSRNSDVEEIDFAPMQIILPSDASQHSGNDDMYFEMPEINTGDYGPDSD